MALSSDQLRVLATLADQWPAADADTRAALRHLVKAQDSAFERAFDAMAEQLDTSDSRTLLPPLSQDQRQAALAASVALGAGGQAALAGTPPPTLHSLAEAHDAQAAKAVGADPLAMALAAGERESGQLVGPYRLIQELGRGGMGVVWLAERADGQHTRQVALKMPLVENLNWLLAARFARERNILASLEHPRIARLYDAGMDEGTQPYIAIEYVQGLPITHYVKAHKLRPEAVVVLFAKVIEAVAHAHTQLVIHRDIKPSNILVDAHGEPHLLDFGIAKLLDDDEAHGVQATQLTKLSGRALTLDYASPEQVNNAALGTASDVYSLGVVLYELLTGSRPYHPAGPTRRDLEQAILDQDPAKPSDQLKTTGDSESGKTARRIRGDLDTIVLTALRKDPKQRYATAQAFADDLKRYLAFEPIQARPASLGYRLRKWLRRQRVPLMVAAVGCAAVTAVGIRALQQQQVAQASQTQAKAVGGLLKSVFAGMSPETASNRKFTAVELLGRAQAYLDTDAMIDVSSRRAANLQIADLYREIGEFSKAIGNFQREEKAASEAHETRAEAMAIWNLADLYTRNQQLDEAQTQVDKLSVVVEQLEPRPDELSARLDFVKGEIAQYQDKPKLAQSLFSSAQKKFDAVQGGANDLNFMIHLSEALASRRVGDLKHAKEKMQQAKAILTLMPNPPQSSEMHLQLQFCNLHLADDMPESASLCFKELLPQFVERFGNGHDDTKFARLALADAQVQSGKISEARHKLSELTETSGSNPLTPNEQYRRDRIEALANMYEGRFDDAALVFRRLSEKVAPGTLLSLSIRRYYAEALLRGGLTVDAIKELLTIENEMRSKFSVTETAICRTQILLGLAHARAGNIGQSMQYLGPSLQVLTRTRGEHHPSVRLTHAYRLLLTPNRTTNELESLSILANEVQQSYGWQADAMQLSDWLRTPQTARDIRQLPIVF